MMIKGVIHLLTIIMGMWVIGEPLMAAEKSPKSNEIQIILYQKGKQKLLDNQSPYFQAVLCECENLFKTADTTYRLIFSKDRINIIKKEESVLEVIYPQVEATIIPFNHQKLYFTKLFIPLTGRFSNGTVFFAGAYAYVLGETKPEDSSLLEYGSTNFVRNTQGLSKLNNAIKKMSIKID